MSQHKICWNEAFATLSAKWIVNDYVTTYNQLIADLLSSDGGILAAEASATEIRERGVHICSIDMFHPISREALIGAKIAGFMHHNERLNVGKDNPFDVTYQDEVGTILDVLTCSQKHSIQLTIQFNSTFRMLTGQFKQCTITKTWYRSTPRSSAGFGPNCYIATSLSPVGAIPVPRFWELMRVLYTHHPVYRHEQFKTHQDVWKSLKEFPHLVCEKSMKDFFGNDVTNIAVFLLK